MPLKFSLALLRKLSPLALLLVVLAMDCAICDAASRVHIITFGKWTSAKWPNATGEKMFELKVRPLLVDARVKEYTTGNPHEVTDRLFVVRRVFRINDALPGESAVRWQWQRGGWLLIDRVSGRISQLNLPEFDSFYSTASWYRDYIAYCGVSDDGKKLSAIVAQVGRHKPILKKDAGEAGGGANPDSACPAPAWERSPLRVTFQQDDGHKVVFSLRNRIVDVVNDAEEPEE